MGITVIHEHRYIMIFISYLLTYLLMTNIHLKYFLFIHDGFYLQISRNINFFVIPTLKHEKIKIILITLIKKI